MITDAVLVGTAALVTALATGLGALPFAWFDAGLDRRLGVANAFASGVMLGASASLLLEGVARSSARTAGGVVAGALFVVAASRALGTEQTLTLGTLSGLATRQALLIVIVMTVHSAAEGVGVGAAFGDGGTFGVLIALAIAIQNIPEGVAISLVLVPRGSTVRSAAVWSVFSSLPQPLLAVPAFLFVERFAAVLPVALGFAAGAMVWMVASSLLPQALARSSRRVVALSTTASFVLMLALQLVLLG